MWPSFFVVVTLTFAWLRRVRSWSFVVSQRRYNKGDNDIDMLMVEDAKEAQEATGSGGGKGR